jgi:hypothetical protein
MEAALAEPRLKTQTDLQKTQLKTQTDMEVARIKGGVDSRKGAMASADKGADREVKVMDILMKAAGDRQKSKEGN